MSKRPLLTKIAVAIVIVGGFISAYKSRHLLQDKVRGIKAKRKSKVARTLAEA